MPQQIDIYSPIKHPHIFGEFADVARKSGELMELGGKIADGKFIGCTESAEVICEQMICEIEQLCEAIRAQEQQQTMFHVQGRKVA